MASGDRGHDQTNSRQVNKVELLIPNQDGVETLKHDGLEVSIDNKARAKFTIFTANNEVILVRAGAEAQQIESALNQAMGEDGHINPSDFLSHVPEMSLPVGAPPQRTIDVIFVEARPTGSRDETSRVTHVRRGDSRLNRLQSEINGPEVQYFIAERSQALGSAEAALVWNSRSESQGKSRTTIFVEGDPSLCARLTGGSNLSLSDKKTFPVGGSRKYGPDFIKPLMQVVTESDVKDQSIPTAEITTRVDRVTLDNALGVIVIR